MSAIDSLFDEYASSHQNKKNKAIHWVCIPLIMLSLLGMLWSIPHAYFGSLLPYDMLNWATLFISATLIYYIYLSRVIFLGMIPVAGGMMVINYWLMQWGAGAGIHHFFTSLAIFTVAWVGQFIGHKIEGKKPSFFKDLQFLLIGPAWLLGHLFRKAGISYSQATAAA